MATLLDEFKSVTGALNDAGIEYAVCDGWAMAIHGLPRATMDIDLLVLPDDVAGIWSIAQKLGYDIEGYLCILMLRFVESPKSMRRRSN